MDELDTLIATMSPRAKNGSNSSTPRGNGNLTPKASMQIQKKTATSVNVSSPRTNGVSSSPISPNPSASDATKSTSSPSGSTIVKPMSPPPPAQNPDLAEIVGDNSVVHFSEQRVERNENPTRDAVAQRRAMFGAVSPPSAETPSIRSPRDDFVSVNMSARKAELEKMMDTVMTKRTEIQNNLRSSGTITKATSDARLSTMGHRRTSSGGTLGSRASIITPRAQTEKKLNAPVSVKAFAGANFDVNLVEEVTNRGFSQSKTLSALYALYTSHQPTNDPEVVINKIKELKREKKEKKARKSSHSSAIRENSSERVSGLAEKRDEGFKSPTDKKLHTDLPSAIRSPDENKRSAVEDTNSKKTTPPEKKGLDGVKSPKEKKSPGIDDVKKEETASVVKSPRKEETASVKSPRDKKEDLKSSRTDEVKSPRDKKEDQVKPSRTEEIKSPREKDLKKEDKKRVSLG